jgi:hypothetical protein
VTADWNNGPLWFAQALLIFSAVYMLWSKWHGKECRRLESPLPSAAGWLLSAAGVGAAALLIRQWAPVGRSILGLQLGYFSSYIFLFALGTIAWRRNWLDSLTWTTVRPWAILSVILLPAMVVTALVSGLFTGKLVDITGGLSFPAIVYAFWEPFVAWGIIAAYLCWFRENVRM